MPRAFASNHSQYSEVPRRMTFPVRSTMEVNNEGLSDYTDDSPSPRSFPLPQERNSRRETEDKDAKEMVFLLPV